MNNTRYLYKLLAILMILVLMSMYLFDSTNYSLQHTNNLTHFLYSGSTDKTSITSYFSGDSDYVGGAKLTMSEEVNVENVEVLYSNGSKLNHPLTTLDKNNYLLNVVKGENENIPQQIIIYANGEQYDVVEIKASSDMLYYFADENQSYRHIYIGETGVFLGEYFLKEFPEDAKQNVIFEFCHKDESTSTGYHVFAKKMVSLFDMTTGKDLGYTAFLNGARFDLNKEVFVIITFSDSHVIEMPLTKGAN